MSAVKEMVDQVMEDMGVPFGAAVESVASTLDMEPAEVAREYAESREDEELEPEPPADL